MPDPTRAPGPLTTVRVGRTPSPAGRRPSAESLLVAVAFVADPSTARAATAQVWSPFVLVGGLILIGLVADEDGLFAALGHRLAALAPNGPVLFGGAPVLVAGVTAVLNLDTSVVFLTPVLVYAARSRGSGRDPAADRLHPCIECREPAPPRIEPHQPDRRSATCTCPGVGSPARMVLPWLGSFLVTAVVDRYRRAP